MIFNFHKVNDNIFRGGAPSVKDVVRLKEKFGIEKIVSLDEWAGKKIDRTTKLLEIKHILLPIDIQKRSSLIHFLHWNIEDLLGGEKMFVHCKYGKDRTGLAVALYRCQHDGWSCKKAINEAKSYGFGIGVSPKIINLYLKIIQKACGCSGKIDSNDAYDIVSNQREYPSDNQDYTLDGWNQQSWSPYADYRVKEYPYTPVYNDDIEEQYDSRQNHDLNDFYGKDSIHNMVQPGQYNNSTEGISGAGPSFVGSGYV